MKKTTRWIYQFLCLCLCMCISTGVMAVTASADTYAQEGTGQFEASGALIGNTLNPAGAQTAAVVSGFVTFEFDETAIEALSAAALSLNANVTSSVSVAISQADVDELRETNPFLADISAADGDIIMLDFDVVVKRVDKTGNLITMEKIRDFGGGTVTVSIPLAMIDAGGDKIFAVYYILPDGSVEKLDRVYRDGFWVCTTDSPGTFLFTEEPYTSEFIDVYRDQWYYEYISGAVADGLFEGYDNNNYGIGDRMLCEDFILVLYRMAGEPAVTGRAPLGVTDPTYYSAVLWAEKIGLIDSTTFAFNVNITREQAAVILCRCADFFKCNVTTGSGVDLEALFTDAGDVTLPEATAALRWAVQAGIMEGNNDGTITPTGDTLREETTKMLYLFNEYLDIHAAELGTVWYPGLFE